MSSGRVVIANAAFLIDRYERCMTSEGVGPTTTLGAAQRSYGTGLIASTDVGYFVSFPGKKGIEFLLDNRTLPERLRLIPDDILTPENERDILSASDTPIIGVRVSQSD